MQDNSNTNGAGNTGIRIGARVVVELLRLRAEKPVSGKILLTPARTKNAMAVLRDRLLQLQLSGSDIKNQLPIAAALEAQCQDLQIPLPVAQPDWGAILLLDELFDLIGKDNQLDEEAMRWLQELRLPVIRYGLMDYSLFFAPQNLLRRFLNQLHLSLLSSSTKSRQLLRESLQPFVQRIRRDFKQDIGTVNTVCIEAQTWFAGHADRVEQIEAQLRSRDSVQRKERVAEPRVVKALNRIAAGKQIPAELLEFIHGEWRRSLRLISMREGEDGATWRRQVRITESLVEFAEGCGDDQGKEKHRSFYPVLMKNIKTLLVSVNEDAQALEKTLDPVELILTALLNGASPDLETVPELQLNQAHITTVEVRQAAAWAERKIDSLQLGDWVRIKTTDGTHELCRLSIRGEADEPWVLVSQSGKTISKKTALQLAQGLEGGVVEVVGQGEWWNERMDAQLAELHQRWQAELAARPAPKPKPKPTPEPVAEKPEPESPAPAPPVSPPDSELELLPQEQLDADVAQRRAQVESRTTDILRDSELSLVALETQAESDDANTDDDEDFLAPHPLTEEEKSAALQAIDQIQVGGWILQQTSKGEERCKLAVKIRGREKLIFVNRLGVKVLEIDRVPLAELLARGLVTIVDTGEKFDNTLERVVRSIQRDRN